MPAKKPNKTRATYDWSTIGNPERMKVFSSVLTEAARDYDFRERCLASAESAKRAFAEVGDVDLPADFRVVFIDKFDSLERTPHVILRLPQYDGPAATPIPANEKNVLCTYSWWRMQPKTAKPSKKVKGKGKR